MNISAHCQLQHSNSAIDLVLLKSYVNDDAPRLKKLIKSFMKSSQKIIHKLETAVADNNYDHWSVLSHNLKGASSFVGAESLRSLCELEEFRDDTTNSTREAQFALISEEYSEIIRSLNNILETL